MQTLAIAKIEPKQLDYVFASDLPSTDETFDDELIEGVLGRGSLAVIYGESNSGKTFAAIDLCASVCRGIPWLGCNADQGLVIYLASESPTSVCMRLRAYQRLHELRVPNFVVVQSPVNLFDSAADIMLLNALVKKIEIQQNKKAALIVGDTLARLVAGANENSGDDMGTVIKNIDAIRAELKCAFVLIHHSGKDAARGQRGWSGMKAAVDTEIECTAQENIDARVLKITKQRDLPTKGKRIGFSLETVILGVNRWGTPRGSCVVVAADAPPAREVGKRPNLVEAAIEEFFVGRNGVGCLRGRIKEHFMGRYNPKSVYRSLNDLKDAGKLIETAGIFALPGKPGPNA